MRAIRPLECDSPKRRVSFLCGTQKQHCDQGQKPVPAGSLHVLNPQVCAATACSSQKLRVKSDVWTFVLPPLPGWLGWDRRPPLIPRLFLPNLWRNCHRQHATLPPQATCQQVGSRRYPCLGEVQNHGLKWVKDQQREECMNGLKHFSGSCV